MKLFYVFTFTLLLFCILGVSAQISGTVFRDFNGNGIKENTATYNNVGLAGVSITAYNAAGASVGTTIKENLH